MQIKQLADGTHLIDFGRVALGNVILHPPNEAEGELQLHFGEVIHIEWQHSESFKMTLKHPKERAFKLSYLP